MSLKVFGEFDIDVNEAKELINHLQMFVSKTLINPQKSNTSIEKKTKVNFPSTFISFFYTCKSKLCEQMFHIVSFCLYSLELIITP